MQEPQLRYRIVNIRRFGTERAVDVVWSLAGGGPLRDDGATEVPDQINVPFAARDQDIITAIEAKRSYLYEALKAPGPGIVIGEPDLPPTALIGQTG